MSATSSMLYVVLAAFYVYIGYLRLQRTFLTDREGNYAQLMTCYAFRSTLSWRDWWRVQLNVWLFVLLWPFPPLFERVRFC